jgi:hypothetical protein
VLPTLNIISYLLFINKNAPPFEDFIPIIKKFLLISGKISLYSVKFEEVL